MDDATGRPAPPPTRSRAGRFAFVAIALAALLAAGIAAFLGTETALQIAIREVERASEGRLRVEDASGSLLSTIRVRRLAWSGPSARVVAEDVALDWSPRALLTRRVAIRGLGAGRIAFEAVASGEPGTVPDDLALPLEVEIDRAAVGRLDWKAPGREGTITGLSFGYAGGALEHRVRDLALAFDRGTLEAAVTLGAKPPFPLHATVSLAGDASLRDARANVIVEGTLRAPTARVEGRVGEARVDARVAATPFADVPLASLDVDAHGVDLATFDAALPRTRLDIRVDAAPAAGGGLAGTARVQNAEPGAWDANRLPLAGAQASFALRASELVLDDLVATLPGGGRAAGRGTVALGGDAAGRSHWTLDVRGLDLARIHGRLAATRLDGRIRADVTDRRQVIVADLSQRDMALAFDAVVDGPRIDATRIRARAGGGTFDGRGSITIDGRRPFEVRGAVERLDPSRFGQFPSGLLSGNVAVEGALAPAWSARGSVTLAPGSRLSGVALSGRASGDVAPGRVRDALVDLAIGRGHATAKGSAGAAGDQLAYTLDALDLADVAKLAQGHAPATLEGIVNAHGTLALAPTSPGGAADVKAERLRIADFAADRLQGHVGIDAGGAASTPLAARNVAIHLEGAGLRADGRSFASATLDADGSLASHRVALAVRGEGLAATLRAHGGADTSPASDGSTSIAWSGTIDALENGGRWPFRLEAPATVTYARGRLATGPFAIAVADGSVRVRDFALADGAVTTHGDFDGVAVAAAFRLAGYKPPLATDLVLGGEWSIAATPRLNGSVSIQRRKGDIYVTENDGFDTSTFSFGLTALSLEARIVDDAVDARLDLKSARAGNAQARAEIGVAPGAAPGRIGGDAPLAATLAADLPTLRALQPWLGTTAAIDGRVRLAATARGRLADPALGFDLAADALRVSAPQYGVYLSDGRLRARDEDGRIVLTEFSIRGGEGRVTASGVLATLGRDGTPVAPDARVEWKAERFRLLNRPDMRLVIDGSGGLGFERGRLSLSGSIDVEQGHFAYTRSGIAELSDDVVIVGGDTARMAHAAPATSPLALDLDVGLGNALTFSGEGLETGLRGRVRITTGANGQLVGRGTIRAVNGTYYAFGQRLTIDRGSLVFDGPLSNPALDIVALRKNQPVEAGVAVTGTVRVPLVTLVSNPPVPDSEKLSWLVLGRSGDAQSGADAAALQAATAALLSRGGKPLTTQIAQRFGLDDISFGSTTATAGTAGGGAANSATGTLQNQVVVLGKRISDRLSIAYQQGLTAASNALVLNYVLTRTLTVRVEAGVISSVGIYYRRWFD